MEAADGVLTGEQARALSQLAQETLEASTEVLSDLVLHRVTAGSPSLSVTRWPELAAQWSGPLLIVRVEYVEGVQGSNLLVMGARDARIIAALMMGEPPDANETALDELQLSAVAEAMNQMMGSAVTSLSELLGRRINISPPVTELRESVNAEAPALPAMQGNDSDEAVVVLSFPLRIEDDLSVPIESRIVQVFPASFARCLADEYLGRQGQLAQPPAVPQATAAPGSAAAQGQAPTPAPAPAPAAAPAPAPAAGPGRASPGPIPASGPAAARSGGSGAGMAAPEAAARWQAPDLASVGASAVGEAAGETDAQDRIPLEVIKRITVPVTVRLGQAYLPLEEVLSLSRGSIVSLDVSDGQPVDVLVSGTLIARGEVVVVREHFGVRITELVRPGAMPD